MCSHSLFRTYSNTQVLARVPVLRAVGRGARRAAAAARATGAFPDIIRNARTENV